MVARQSAPKYPDMRPAMLPTELVLLEAVLSCSDDYVEFGAGGSTVWASHLVGKTVTSVDSSREWLIKVEQYCRMKNVRLTPLLVLADIGPIRNLGYPADDKHKSSWPRYYCSVWEIPNVASADTYLVDGRFRVASFMKVMLQGNPRAHVLIHDFANRPEYHVVHEFAREIARTDNLSVFQRLPVGEFPEEAAWDRLKEYALDPR
jgi:hypothetical protein